MKHLGAVAVLAPALTSSVEGAEIRIISTGGAQAVMTALVPEFERKSGNKVQIDFGTPGNMRDRLVQGEPADAAVAIAAVLPDLEKAGTPKPDVSSAEGVKHAVLAAKTIVLSDPKAGTQLGATFLGATDRLGFGA